MMEKYALMKVIKSIIRLRNEFSIRETAKKISVSPSTAKEALDFLLTQSILQKRIVGKNHLFNVNDSFLTRQIKRLYSLAELNSAKIVEEILKKDSNILSILVYGSVASGIDYEDSDIDMLIISRKPVKIPELKGEALINREITIIAYSHNEWREKAIKDKAFYINVISNCIPLYGEVPIVI